MSAHRRLLYFSYKLPVFIVLLGLLVASSVSADPVVNGTVGESVVLPAGLSPQDNPSELEWKWGGINIADKDNSDVTTDQFRHRVHLNRTDWSLTINLLRAEDSGEYNRVATAASGRQLPTHTVTLRVYEKIESKVTRKPSHETCRATLLCTTNQREHVSYRWKRGDQDLPEHAGILEASLSPGEINVTFTCIASNPASKATASIRESCADKPWWRFDWWIYAGTAGILLLVVLISIVITVAMRKKKKRSEAVTETPEQMTVYAQIERKSTLRNHLEKSSNAQQSDNLPMTVYETVNLEQLENSSYAQQSDNLPMTTVYATVNLKQAPGKSCHTQNNVVKFNRNEETSPYQSVQ
ncbi:T-lymphocyte surface antigen Ly-9-like [Acipenser ruthenus]|uniref:T-lymphocyte surface antigen Ly-9-like n=1 Tax=Acipenser ruthenus TaxID=7906 RepID=UPI002741D8EA|nr:T-lymphocyte surface antigen Ly-9-like [Acipenser ruthenus]